MGLHSRSTKRIYSYRGNRYHTLSDSCRCSHTNSRCHSKLCSCERACIVPLKSVCSITHSLAKLGIHLISFLKGFTACSLCCWQYQHMDTADEYVARHKLSNGIVPFGNMPVMEAGVPFFAKFCFRRVLCFRRVRCFRRVLSFRRVRCFRKSEILLS